MNFEFILEQISLIQPNGLEKNLGMGSLSEFEEKKLAEVCLFAIL